MAEDLGTWPPEQATVLLEALQHAGLTPDAKRTRDGILVTVPDAQADEAHRTLVSNMDTIARAARSPVGQGQRRRQRAGRDARRGDQGSGLATGRLASLARPLALLLLGAVVATIIPPLRLLVIVATIGAVVYVVGKQAQRDGDGDS